MVLCFLAVRVQATPLVFRVTLQPSGGIFKLKLKWRVVYCGNLLFTTSVGADNIHDAALQVEDGVNRHADFQPGVPYYYSGSRGGDDHRFPLALLKPPLHVLAGVKE